MALELIDLDALELDIQRSSFRTVSLYQSTLLRLIAELRASRKVVEIAERLQLIYEWPELGVALNEFNRE